MQNNPILDANLACIAKYNPILKYNILKIKELSKPISLTETLLKEPNLLYNNVPIHDFYGAEAQAKNIFAKTKNSPLMMHVIFGMGLGYLFQEYALNSQGIVMLYEPDIEVLAVTLEIVDFTKELSRPNVFVYSDWNEFKKAYLNRFIYNSDTSITFLESYKHLFQNELNDFANKLNFVMGAAIVDNNYVSKKLIPAVKQVCSNIDNLVNEPPLMAYKNAYFGKTAVVVSAGPTLDKTIETLKKHRDKYILLAVGQALRTLITNGITPDFVGLVETQNQMAQIEGLDVSKTNLILEPASYGGLHQVNFKNKILYPTKNSQANKIWATYSETEASKYIASGTVSYMMLNSAIILGCKDIILVGQDLAFLDGKCYSGLSQHNGIKFAVDKASGKAGIKIEDIDLLIESLFSKNSSIEKEKKIEIAKKRIETMNKNLYTVPGIKGNQLFTTIDYAYFRKQFMDFAEKYKNIFNLYNTSLEGAKIDGFKDIPLEDILKDKPTINKIELKTDFKYNIKNIYTRILMTIDALNKILKTLNSASTLIANYDREFKRKKQINIACLNILKQLIVMYYDFSELYAQESQIFRTIQKPLKLELDYTLKNNRGSDSESIKKVYSQLKIYITQLSENIKEVKTKLESKVKILDEMLDTEG